MRIPHQLSRFLFFVLVLIGVTACSDRNPDSGGGGNSPGNLRLQVVNTSANSPELDFFLDGTRIARLDFLEATTRTSVKAGGGVLLVTADTPTGPVNALGPTALGLTRNLKTTLIAFGTYAGLSTLKIQVPDSPVPAGKARIQLANTAPAGVALDIYLTVPGVPITGTTPVARLDFGQFGTTLDLDAGTIDIQITRRNDTNVIYNSGAFSLVDGDDLLFTVVDNPTSVTSLLSLLVLDDAGGSEVLSADTPADFRATHASPGTGPLDVRVTPTVGAPTTVFTNLARGEVTTFAQLDPDLYEVDFLFTGTPITAVGSGLGTNAGEQYTVYAANVPGNLDLFASNDNRRPIATEARLQIVDLAATLNVGPIDIYVVPTGEPILLATPHLEDVDYQDVRTDYRALAADDYDLVVTAAGSKIELSPRLALGPLLDGGIYAVVVRDDGFGGLEFTRMDDL